MPASSPHDVGGLYCACVSLEKVGVSRSLPSAAPPSVLRAVYAISIFSTSDSERKEEMAEINLETEYIIVIVLGVVLVLLLLVFLCFICVFLRKRRALCFRDREDEEKPFILPDKTLEERYKKCRESSGKREKKKGGKKAKGKQLKYSRLGQSPHLRRPRGDPFAHNYLENPMLDTEEMNVDWSNPVFDAERSRNRDAAICIQSWFRMIR